MAVTRSWLCLHVVFGVPFFRRSYKGLIKDIPPLVCSEVLFKRLCPHRAVLLHTANPCWAKLPLMCINQPNCVMGERGLYSTVVILQIHDVFSQMGLAFAFELSLKLLEPEHWWCEDPLANCAVFGIDFITGFALGLIAWPNPLPLPLQVSFHFVKHSALWIGGSMHIFNVQPIYIFWLPITIY